MKSYLKNSISIMDAIITTVGIINTISGFIVFDSINWLIPTFIVFTGISLIIYMIFNAIKERKISIYIMKNEEKIRKQINSPFNDIEKIKTLFFVELSQKYPQMTCVKLRKMINKHYELN